MVLLAEGVLQHHTRRMLCRTTLLHIAPVVVSPLFRLCQQIPCFILKTIVCLSLAGNFLSVFVLFCVCLCVCVQASMGDFTNGLGAKMLQMAAKMEAQAKEL